MAVQVKINGKGPYRLIFDTGARRTSSTQARQGNRHHQDKKDDKAPGFALFGMPALKTIDTLEVGGVKLKKSRSR